MHDQMHDAAQGALPYRLVAANGSHEIEVKKSRFVCSLARAGSEEEARAFIESVRKAHWNANHNCTAWVIGPGQRLQRSNDDGEPSGTAGTPMLEVLKRRGVTDTVAVVTRYFGGTLLGAGGLIRAYGQAVTAALDHLGIVERRPLDIVQLVASYEEAGKIEHAIRASDYPLTDVRYGADVTIDLALERERLEPFRHWIAELSGGRVAVAHIGQRFVEVPV